MLNMLLTTGEYVHKGPKVDLKSFAAFVLFVAMNQRNSSRTANKCSRLPAWR